MAGDDVSGIFAAGKPDPDPYAPVNRLTTMQNNITQAQTNQVHLEQQKLELAKNQISTMSGFLTDLLNDPKAGRESMMKEITQRAAYGVKQGLWTPAQSVEMLKTVPTDAREQYKWLTTHLGSLMTAEQKLNAYIGSQKTEGVGGGSVTTQTPAIPAAPGTPQKPPQVRAVQPYSLPPTQEGVETAPGPNQGARGPIGPAAIQPPYVPQGGAPAAPVAPSPGARPPAPAPSAGPTAAPPPGPAAPAGPQGRVISAMPPGTSEAMAGSVQNYNHATEAGGNYAYRVNPLRQAIPILEKMKNTDTGPIQERINDLKSAAQSLGAGPLLGIDPEKIKDFNELKKYFSQYSVQASAAMGPKTNEGMAAAVTSNPNVKMDRLSALDLSKVALGVERMRQAGVLAFQELVQKNLAHPNQFNQFMLDWGTRMDPRAFVYDLMTPDQRAKVRKLPEKEQKKIHDAMVIADRFGLLGDIQR
jgi:hypothetical protein